MNVKKTKILVCWYGSIKNNGTIGDLYAVSSLINFLNKTYDISCVSYEKFSNINCSIYSPEYIDLVENVKMFDIMVFCCGPIIKSHTNFNNLMNKFNNIYKIGVSVSLFDKNHYNFINPFDFVLSRQGEEKYEDIAILAQEDNNEINNANKPICAHQEIKMDNMDSVDKINKEITIGLCLRGFQSEYGSENCLHNKVNDIINNTTNPSFDC